MANRLRQYQPIWLALKKHKTISVYSPPHLHARLIKAVIKEKYMDDRFKKKEGWRKMWLTYSINSETNEVTFFLNYRLNELTAGDL
jgi:hypothetical protein